MSAAGGGGGQPPPRFTGPNFTSGGAGGGGFRYYNPDVPDWIPPEDSEPSDEGSEGAE